jgi:hypothetical protein
MKSRMSFIDKLTKISDRHEEHYALFTEIIGKLQPIAFLISVSLVLAVFFSENSISRKYAVFASLSFFFAYLSFIFYKVNNYRISFYWGILLTFIGVSLIYQSFRGVLPIITSIDSGITTLAIYIIAITSFLFVRFFLDKSNKNNLQYKISNIAFYAVVVLIITYIPMVQYLNLTVIPLFFALLLLFLITLIAVTNN